MSDKPHYRPVHSVNNIKVVSGRFRPNGTGTPAAASVVPLASFTPTYAGSTGTYLVTLPSKYRSVLTAKASVINGATGAYTINCDEVTVSPPTPDLTNVLLKVFLDEGAGAGAVAANIASGDGDICFTLELIDGEQG